MWYMYQSCGQNHNTALFTYIIHSYDFLVHAGCRELCALKYGYFVHYALLSWPFVPPPHKCVLIAVHEFSLLLYIATFQHMSQPLCLGVCLMWSYFFVVLIITTLKHSELAACVWSHFVTLVLSPRNHRC
jgi:hypothetical protein